MCIEKIRALSYIGVEKITFIPISDGRTDRPTGRWTDISNYSLASLLKMWYNRAGLKILKLI